MVDDLWSKNVRNGILLIVVAYSTISSLWYWGPDPQILRAPDFDDFVDFDDFDDFDGFDGFDGFDDFDDFDDSPTDPFEIFKKERINQ